MVASRRRRALVTAVLASALLAGGGEGTASAQDVESTNLSGLDWRHVGPPGNRASSAVGEPGDASVMYVGAASGGVWRTMDGGVNWKPVFDDQPAASVTSLAVAPSRHNEVWAGTGEIYYIRPYTAVGNGIYKSTNRGDSWTHMGLEETGRISRIVVHPEDSDVVYACALGHGFAPQQERGVFKTTDGGRTWEKIFFVNEDTGCSDLAMDPEDPGTLFAGMWQVNFRPWNLDSGGPGSGVFVTHDGGDSWEGVGGGLPQDSMGKVSVDVAPTDPDRVYAMIEESPDPGLYRSSDGGETWALVNRRHIIFERPAYYGTMRVSTGDRDRLYFTNIEWSISRDGGESIDVDVPQAGHDSHNMWVDPENPDRILVAHDGGLGFTLNGGKTWEQERFPIAQVYHVTVDTRVPYYVYSNRQDGPSFMAPSDTRSGGRIYASDWRNFGGGESGWGVPDTTTNRYVYSGSYDGALEVLDLENMQRRDIEVWPMSAIGWPPRDVRERFEWVFPIDVSPHGGERVYVGSQRVHMTTDRGHSFEVISPDLTRDVEENQDGSGGLTWDNLQTFNASVLYSIAESPVREGVIWTGSKDGLVHVSRDGGDAWTNVTGKMPDMPKWGWVRRIQPSFHDAGTAYVAVTNHMMGDFEPYVYRTDDYGQSWTRIDGDLPRSVFGNVYVVREDPEVDGLLYAGTENKIYFSLDDGEHWQPLDTNMPAAPVYSLTVQPHFDDLVVGTYGRGIWILDDITPIRNLDRDVVDAPLHVFQPRDTYRFQPVTGKGSPTEYELDARNAPNGTPISYYLAEGREDSVTIAVSNADGDTVRTLIGPARDGINRVWWDLRHDPFVHPQLRTDPPGRDWVAVPDTGREPVTWGTGYHDGPEVVPGTYTVTVTASDRSRSRSFEVIKDPHSAGTVQDVEEQVALSLDLREEYGRVRETVNRLEWIRAQLADLTGSLEEAGAANRLRTAVREAEKRAVRVEHMLIDVNLTGGVEDAFRNPMKLHGRYLELMQDVSGSSDHPPTEAQREVHRALREQLVEAEKAFRAYLRDDLSRLNDLVREADLPAVASSLPDG